MERQQLKALARTISEAADQLNDLYDEESQELRFPGGKPTDEQTHAVDTALEAALLVQRMLLGPIERVVNLASNEQDAAVLHVIHDHNIAKHVPAKGAITYDDLSAASGVPVAYLRSIIRHGMTNGIFIEPTPGAVAHSLFSRRMADDPLMRATVGVYVTEQFPAAAHLSRIIPSHAHPTEETKTAWGLANHAQRPMFEELEARHPVRADQFSAFMKHNWSILQPLKPFLDTYDWTSLGSAHIVDIGGGFGQLSIALAKSFPNLRFTVQDFPKIVETGEKYLKEEHAELQERVKFMAHDAFKDQPVHGADIYMFRSIFHNWPDEDCVQILKKLIPALKSGAKVLLNDYVLPDPGEVDLLEERRARTLDLIMLSLFKARERPANEWAPLFEKADTRFRFKGIRPCDVNDTGIPTKRLLSIIEAVWEA